VSGSLPTPRSTLRTGGCVLCGARRATIRPTPTCRRVVDMGRSDVPLIKCYGAASDRTDFVVTSRDNPQPW
jgi:hypothetical protein